MGISAAGVGSGLDVSSIISQLMELEQKPLQALQTKATDYQAKLSAFGQLKSQIANLQDQAAKLAKSSNWDALSFSSSNTAAISGSIDINTAKATNLSVSVSQLAQAQATASDPVASDTTYGAGQLSIQIGSWDNTTFTAGSAAAVNVSVSAGDDLGDIAAKINAAKAGVTATVLNDASGSRLILKSDATGKDAAFRVQSSGDASLDALRYDPAAGAGMTRSLEALNTEATVNGVPVSSTNNKLENAVPGVTLNFLQTTTAPVTIKVSQDTASIKSSISGLVQSYNALSNALKEMTKYVASTDTAGTLQGDATAVGLQNALNRIFTGSGQASSGFRSLSEIGVQRQLDGTLSIDDTKLAAALQNPDSLEAFFASDGGDSQSGGLAERIEGFAKGLLASSGSIGSRYSSIEAAIKRNTTEQDRVNDRIERTRERLTQQYSKLDSTLATLNSLSTYVEQQITTWNNQKSS